MTLWLLRPIGYAHDDDTDDAPDAWHPWYDKAFGFVIRAETEAEARAMAHKNGGYETPRPYRDDPTPPKPWLDATQSTCVPLTSAGDPVIVMQDFHAA